MKRIAVLGGTGFLGRSVCERLVRAGGGGATTIVVPTRRAMHADCIRPLPGVDIRVADVHDDKALARLLSGCDAVVNLVAILHGNQRAFEQVHVLLPQRLARACKGLGVRRLVHVSALGVTNKPSEAPSLYLRSKAEGEQALRGAGLDLTVLRPSVMFGAGDRFLNLFAQLQAVFPVMPLAGADAQFQPVWVEDVAEAIVRCLQRPETIGQTFECAGPQTYTLAELVRAAGRWAGHERWVFPLPAWLGRMQALAMEWLPGEPLMSRDNLDSMKRPNVASGSLPGLAALDIAAVSPEAVVPDYLGRRSGAARLDPLRARAGRAG